MLASFLHASEISPNHCQRISSSPGMFRAENKLSLVSRQCYEQFSESALLCFALAWMGLYTHTSFPKFIRSICAQRHSATYLSKRKFLVLPDILGNTFCEGFISRAEGIRQNTSAFGNTNFKSTGIFSLHSAAANPRTVKCCFRMFVSKAPTSRR